MRLKQLLSLYLLLVTIWGCERPTDVTPGDGIPPATPSGVIITYAQDGGIFVEWNSNPAPDLKCYNIYRSVNNDTSFQLLFTTNNFYYFDDSLSYDIYYTYRITSVDVQDMESLPSDTIGALPKNINPPAIPARFFFSVQGRNWDNKESIELNWQASEDADISHYNIYRDTVDDFTADNTKFIGSSVTPSYSDTINILLYKKYFYKLKAVDNGGLLSKESHSESDIVMGIPALIFPANNSRINYFQDFVFKGVSIPARYRIVLQTNKYFGEFWGKDFISNPDDSISIAFDPPFLELNTTYYWRIAVYSEGKSEPNSISDQYQFIIKP